MARSRFAQQMPGNEKPGKACDGAKYDAARADPFLRSELPLGQRKEDQRKRLKQGYGKGNIFDVLRAVFIDQILNFRVDRWEKEFPEHAIASFSVLLLVIILSKSHAYKRI
jgi:hypothetical protein